MSIPADWSIVYHWNVSTNTLQGVSDARAICPCCKIASTFTVDGQHFYREGDKTVVHLVLRCNYAKCKRAMYVRTSNIPNRTINNPSDDFFMYPSRAVDDPHPGIPVPISEDWAEGQKAMQASAPKAAAVMFRRVLYGILLDKGCKLHPLRDGMAQLIATQRLPAIFDEWLPAIKDDGHDAAHPDRALHVSAENVTETMEYTAELLRFLYVEPYEFQQRKARNTPLATPATNS